MNSSGQSESAQHSRPTRLILREALDLLASVKFAVAIIVIIVAACVVGTLLPQGTEAAAYIQKNPEATHRFEVFAKLGLTHVFSAPWFIALLCVLTASVTACSTRRLATIKRTSGFAQRRAVGSMLTHLSILLILSGAVTRGIWGEKGSVALREGETVSQFQGDKGIRPLPFALQLTKFEIESDAPVTATANISKESSPTMVVQWTDRGVEAVIPANEGTIKDLMPDDETPSSANTFHIQVLKYVPDFTINSATHEVTTRSSQPNNPAVLVAVNGPNYQNHRWVFARFPDIAMHEDGSPITASPLRFFYYNGSSATPSSAEPAPIKNFKSTLKLLANGNSPDERTLAVNSPLKFKGYTFYQTGYNPNDLTWTSLQVVRDPGVPLVYGGFILLISGLFVVFYLNPWLTAREATI